MQQLERDKENSTSVKVDADMAAPAASNGGGSAASGPPKRTASVRSEGTLWSEAEHERFLNALEAHGGVGDVEEAWAAISSAVSTRSTEEVKLHAHEYFFKLQNERTIIAASHSSQGSRDEDTDELPERARSFEFPAAHLATLKSGVWSKLPIIELAASIPAPALSDRARVVSVAVCPHVGF